MARLLMTGAEEQATAAFPLTTGGISFSTTVFRSGLASFRFVAASNTGYVELRTDDGITGQTNWVGFSLRITTAPSATTRIAQSFLSTGTPSTNGHSIRLTASRTLQFWDNVDVAQLGSDSAALDLNTWYRVEWASTWNNGTCSARLNGVEFASDTSFSDWGYFRFGYGTDAVSLTSGEWHIDDIAINDNTGANQNTWPGDGKIVHMYVDGAGESAAVTGTFADIDDPAPPDTSTEIELTTNATSAFYTCQSAASAGIEASDTINCVAVGMYWRAETAASATARVRIESQSGGVKTESAAVTNALATHSYHDDAIVSPWRKYKLIQHTDPQAGGAWTPALIDTMQLGFGNSTDANPDIWCSWLWAAVEFVPAGAAATLPPRPIIVSQAVKRASSW